MKFFQFFTFTLMAAISAALLIVGMATLHWVTTNNTGTVAGFQGQTHSGLRRWYNEVNGNSDSSQKWNRDNCGGNYDQSAQCDFYQSGSWGLGWGIGALACIALAVLMVALISCVTLFHGARGKFTASFLMFLAFACTLVGALTYWSHLPNLSNSDSNLSWSFILYCIGGGVALATSIVLCMLPTKHYYSTTTIVTQPTVYTNNTTTTTTTSYPAAAGAAAGVVAVPAATGYPTTTVLTPKYPSYAAHTSEMPAYPANHYTQQPTSIVVQ